MVELGDVGDDGPPVQQPPVNHVGGLKQSRDVELSLCQAEGHLTVLIRLTDIKAVELYEVGSEPGDDGAEGESITPGGGEVSDGDPGVSLRDLTAPLLEPCHSDVKHPN